MKILKEVWKLKLLTKLTVKKAVKKELSVLIFIERLPDVENLFKELEKLEPLFNPNAKEYSLIGKISSLEDQELREEELECFYYGQTLILVTTNVCSRGLNLAEKRVDIVIHYTLPEWTDGKAYKGYGRQENDYIYR